jgi:hypothetical protein
MSLLFDADELRNFRDKLPTVDFTEIAGLVGNGSNLAGSMEESQNIQRIHVVLLRDLEAFGTELPLGVEGLRQFAGFLISSFSGADGDNAERVRRIRESFRHVEGKPTPDISTMFPKLPDPEPKS